MMLSTARHAICKNSMPWKRVIDSPYCPSSNRSEQKYLTVWVGGGVWKLRESLVLVEAPL